MDTWLIENINREDFTASSNVVCLRCARISDIEDLMLSQENDQHYKLVLSLGRTV